MLVACLSLSCAALADQVQCYSKGTLIYNEKHKKAFIGEGYVWVKNKNNSEVIVADCIVRYKTNFAHHKKSH